MVFSAVFSNMPNLGSAANWWLRSPNTGNTNNEYNVTGSGGSNNNNSNNANGCAPDCNIFTPSSDGENANRNSSHAPNVGATVNAATAMVPSRAEGNRYRTVMWYLHGRENDATIHYGYCARGMLSRRGCKSILQMYRMMPLSPYATRWRNCG